MKDATSTYSTENIAFAAILGLVGIVGISGNILRIIQLVKLSVIESHDKYFYLIATYFHHAIANILLLLTIPFSISEKLNGYWNFSQGVCKFYQGIIYFTYSMSLLAILARIVAALISQNYREWKDHKKFYTKQYYVLCDFNASTLEIVLQTMYLCDFRKEEECKFVDSKLKDKFLYKYYLVSTSVIYIISVLIALPVFVYSDKNGFEFCSCNILFPGTKYKLRVCEEFVAKFSEFNFNCSTKICISQQEVPNFRNVTENFLRNIANATRASDVNIINSINATSKTVITFQSTTANLIDFYEYENFSVSFTQEHCLENLKHASISLKLFIWFNLLYLFFVFFFLYILVKFTVRTIRRHGVQLFGNKPKLLRNNRKFRASIKQNVDECLNKFLKVNFKNRFLTLRFFALCWFIYYLIKIIKLYFYFSLSENVCRTLSDVSMLTIYINAGISILISIFMDWDLIKSDFLRLY